VSDSVNGSVNDSVNRDGRRMAPGTSPRPGFGARAADVVPVAGGFNRPLTIGFAIYCPANRRVLLPTKCALTRADALYGSPDSLNHSVNHSVSHSLEEGNGREWKGSKNMAGLAWHRDLAIARAPRDAMRSAR
jgi:hypothetical protein